MGKAICESCSQLEVETVRNFKGEELSVCGECAADIDAFNKRSSFKKVERKMPSFKGDVVKESAVVQEEESTIKKEEIEMREDVKCDVCGGNAETMAWDGARPMHVLNLCSDCAEEGVDRNVYTKRQVFVENEVRVIEQTKEESATTKEESTMESNVKGFVSKGVSYVKKGFSVIKKWAKKAAPIAKKAAGAFASVVAASTVTTGMTAAVVGGAVVYAAAKSLLAKVRQNKRPSIKQSAKYAGEGLILALITTYAFLYLFPYLVVWTQSYTLFFFYLETVVSILA